jgi:hypothetical protein
MSWCAPSPVVCADLYICACAVTQQLLALQIYLGLQETLPELCAHAACRFGCFRSRFCQDLCMCMCMWECARGRPMVLVKGSHPSMLPHPADGSSRPHG